MGHQPSLAALWQGVQQGDESAFEKLFHELYAPLCGYAFKLLAGRQEAEDAVQEVMLKLWERRNSISPGQSVRSYIFRAVFNHCMDQLAHRRSLAPMPLAQQAQAALQPWEDQELEQAVVQAIASLPTVRRRVFLLSREEEKSYKEIAQELSISTKTVENHMGAALRQLRQALAAFLTFLIIFTHLHNH